MDRNTISAWHGSGAKEIGCGSEKLSIWRQDFPLPEFATCASKRSGVKEHFTYQLGRFCNQRIFDWVWQDWYNCTATSDIRSWTRDDPADEPWKDDFVSPLRSIPAADNPWRLRTDPAHTFAIQGFGSSMASSAVVLLSRLKICPGRSTQDRLNWLYDSFIAWCRRNQKSTSLDHFTLLKFKMKTSSA